LLTFCTSMLYTYVHLWLLFVTHVQIQMMEMLFCYRSLVNFFWWYTAKFICRCYLYHMHGIQMMSMLFCYRSLMMIFLYNYVVARRLALTCSHFDHCLRYHHLSKIKWHVNIFLPYIYHLSQINPKNRKAEED